MLLTVATIAGLGVCLSDGSLDAQAACRPTPQYVVSVAAESRWGIDDPEILARLERELLGILEGPMEHTRGGELSEEDQSAIESDPELHEAYRSAPAATLELIQRIREAGGLKN